MTGEHSIDDNPFVTLTYEPKGRRDEKQLRERYKFTGKCILNFYPALVSIFGEPVGLTLAYHRYSVFVGLALGISPASLSASTPG